MYSEVDLFDDCERIASRFSKIKSIEIAGIWEVICKYIENQLVHGKACSLQGLGKFSYISKKIDTGTSGIKEQRLPVFVLNESFVRLHGLRISRQPYISPAIPVVEVNYFLIAQRASTIKEVVTSILKVIYNRLGVVMSTGKTVGLAFKSIGKLSSDRKIVDFTFEKRFLEPVEFRYMEVPKSGPSTPSRMLRDVRRSPSPSLSRKNDSFRIIADEDLKLLESGRKQSVSQNRTSSERNDDKICTDEVTVVSDKEEIETPDSQVDASSDSSFQLTRPPSRNSSRSAHTPRLTPSKLKRHNDVLASPPITKYRSLSPAPYSPCRHPSPSPSFSRSYSPSNSVRSHSSLALTSYSHSSVRSPSRENLDSVMYDAFTRQEREVQKRLREQAEDRLMEQQMVYRNAEAERRMLEYKKEIEKDNQSILMKQMELDRRKRLEEEDFQKRSDPSETSLHVEGAEGFPRLRDYYSKDSFEDEKRKQRERREELDRQLLEKMSRDQHHLKAEREEEAKLVDKAKKEFEQERNYLKQRKRETQNELKMAWSDQLFLTRDKNPNWASHTPLSLSWQDDYTFSRPSSAMSMNRSFVKQ